MFGYHTLRQKAYLQSFVRSWGLETSFLVSLKTAQSSATLLWVHNYTHISFFIKNYEKKIS